MKANTQKTLSVILAVSLAFSLSIGVTLAYLTRETEKRANNFTFLSSNISLKAMLTEPNWDGVTDYEYQIGSETPTYIYEWIDDDGDAQTPNVPVYGYVDGDKSQPITDKAQLTDTSTRPYTNLNDDTYAAPGYGIDTAQNMLPGEVAQKNPIITNKGSVDIWVAAKSTFVYSNESEYAGLKLSTEDLYKVLAVIDIDYQTGADDDWERVEGTESALSQVFYYKYLLGKDENLDDVGVYGEVTTPIFYTVTFKSTATKEQIKQLYEIGGFAIWIEGFAAQGDVADSYDEFKAWGLGDDKTPPGVVFSNTPDNAPYNGAQFTWNVLTSEQFTDENGITYDGTVEITGYTGSETSVVFPSSVYGIRTLTDRGDNVSSGTFTYTDNAKRYKVTSVVGDSANTLCMYGLGNATGIVLSDSLATIGDYAFYKCSNLTGTLTIPDGVTSIGKNSFYNCSELTGNLTIPSSVTSIGNYAFRYCSGFNSLTLSEGLKTIGTYAFCNDTGFEGTLTIPSTLTSISNYAFYSCSGFAGELIIPSNIKTIGNYAFRYCTGFNSLTLSEGLKTIGSYAFSNDTGLKGTLTIPSNVTSIGNYAFFATESTGLTTLILNEGLTTIGDGSFYSCYFKGTLTIPSTVTSIGNNTFVNGRYSAIKVEDGNTAYVSVDDVLFDIDMTALIQYPTSKKSTSYTVPSTVTKICGLAFYRCYSLKTITIPTSVTSIEQRAFSYCTGLTGTFTVPQSVTSIGDRAFSECTNITLLRLPNRFTESFGFTGTVEYYSE